MKNQEDMIPPKKHSKLPITDLKEMEKHELPSKELKIIVLKAPRELQENTDKQFNKIRKKYKNKIKSNKEIENIKENQTKIVELRIQ